MSLSFVQNGKRRQEKQIMKPKISTREKKDQNRSWNIEVKITLKTRGVKLQNNRPNKRHKEIEINMEKSLSVQLQPHLTQRHIKSKIIKEKYFTTLKGCIDNRYNKTS